MIIRTYRCDDCEHTFEVTCESNDGDPDCPTCSKVLEWTPVSFAITGVKAKAVDYTQKILEQDYGLSNFRDNNREGDVAAMGPAPETTAEREKVVRAVKEYAESATMAPELKQQGAPAPANFWGGQPAMGIQTNPIAPSAMLAGTKVGPRGYDTMKILHDGIRTGQLTTPTRILARWKP